MSNRIIVVEDDEGFANGIALNLQYVGYEFKVFCDGDEAVSYLATDHEFDLALLDIMLPGANGYELLNYTKKYNIPTIFMTARNDTASEVKGLRDGAEDFLVKPFDVITLLVRIEKVLDRAGKLDCILNFQDIVVDVGNRTITKAGQMIVLKPLEFDVLVMLMRNKNRTVPRERILNEVWGIDFVGSPRTVDVHIANIRKKLCMDNQIATISKIGYRLEEI